MASSSSLEECYNRSTHVCLQRTWRELCAIIKRALDCGQNFTFTLAEKIRQVIIIENRTGRLAKENKKVDRLCFHRLCYLLSLWFSSVASGDSC